MAQGGAALSQDAVSRARRFSAAQNADIRALALRDLGDEKEVQGERQNDNELAPVLELPKKSYTTSGEGVTSRIAEMERQRAAQAKMTETARSFTGGPALRGGARAEGSPDESGTRPRQRRAPTETTRTEVSPEEEDAYRVGALEESRSQKASKQKELSITQQRIQQVAALANEQKIKLRFQMMKRGLAAGSISGWMLLLLLLLMNVQVINTFAFKSAILPKADTKDIMLTAFGDLLFLFALLLTLAPLFMIIVLVVVLVQSVTG